MVHCSMGSFNINWAAATNSDKAPANVLFRIILRKKGEMGGGERKTLWMREAERQQPGEQLSEGWTKTRAAGKWNGVQFACLQVAKRNGVYHHRGQQLRIRGWIGSVNVLL